MSDTPRTDKLLEEIRAKPGSGGCIPKDFARQLERENSQLRKLIGLAAEDSARLDWMNLHQASISVSEPDPMPCVVEASDDFQLTGRSDPYDVRKAIDAARKAET